MTTATQNQLWHRLWRYAPVVIWVSVIFLLGSNQGSMDETSRFIRPILHFLFPNSPEQTIDFIHGYIRKFAHLFEYGVLAVLAARALAASSIDALKKYAYPTALLLVLLVASTDEFRQSYEPARTASPYDVLIDLTGGAIALSLYFVTTRSLRRRNRRTASGG